MNSINSLFKYGTVVDVDDSLDGDRIKVQIKGVDPANFTLDDIPYAFPMLPKQLYIKPKIGEIVFVLVQSGSYEEDRFYIGPIISQPDKIDFDSITAQAFLKSGLLKPGIAPSTIPENAGLQFEKNDVGLQGRGSTDVMVKPNEIRIRAGKSLDMRTLNKVNQTYIQTKFNKSTNEGVINIVSDYINILSHKGIDKFNLNDPTSLISDEEYKKILEKAHQLPFGDVLVDFFNLFIKAFATHIHAYAGLPPDLNQVEVKNLLSFEMENVLSKNIRIN